MDLENISSAFLTTGTQLSSTKSRSMQSKRLLLNSVYFFNVVNTDLSIYLACKFICTILYNL